VKIKDIITEVLDTKLNWNYSSHKTGKQTIHEFVTEVDGSKIKLTIDDEPGVVAEVYFERDGRMNATGQGSASVIFGAVLNKLVEWLNEQPAKPRQIYFTAQNPEKADSREGLYDKMIKRYADKLGYTSRKIKTKNLTSYYLDLKEQ
jgi:hypothetical protein